MDLTNDILRDEKWESDEINIPLSENLDALNSDPNTNPNSFGSSWTLLVEVNFFPEISGGYIYDIVTLFIGICDWIKKRQNLYLI